MSSRLIKVNDLPGKRRARLGTSRPLTIGHVKPKESEPKKTEESGSVAKRKQSASFGRHIDTLIRRCEQASYVVMACVMFLYILDDGYIFYGLGGYIN